MIRVADFPVNVNCKFETRVVGMSILLPAPLFTVANASLWVCNEEQQTSSTLASLDASAQCHSTQCNVSHAPPRQRCWGPFPNAPVLTIGHMMYVDSNSSTDVFPCLARNSMNWS